MIKWNETAHFSGPTRAGLAVIPIAILTVCAFFGAFFLFKDTCIPVSWFCGLLQAWGAGLIALPVISYLILRVMGVGRPTATALVGPVLAILGVFLAGNLSGWHQDSPGLTQLILAVGLAMVAYGATNYLLTERQDAILIVIIIAVAATGFWAYRESKLQTNPAPRKGQMSLGKGSVASEQPFDAAQADAIALLML